jgi:chromosome condensin MukBEF ATPase and DNA-binding subunit MukB
MKGSALKNLRMFGDVLGNKAMPNVIMVTTKWSNVGKEGVKREQELKTHFWKDMIADGCGIARFEDSYDSAWSIIESLRGEHPAQVQLPREIVDSKHRLNETQAGIALNKELDKLIKHQKDMDRRFGQLVQTQDNELVIQELNQQRTENEVKIRQTEDQMRQMKIPLTRRIRLFFKGRG